MLLQPKDNQAVGSETNQRQYGRGEYVKMCLEGLAWWIISLRIPSSSPGLVVRHSTTCSVPRFETARRET